MKKNEIITNPDQIKQTQEFKVLTELTDKLNSYTFDPEIFAAGLPLIHHTIQQSFFRLIKACVIFMAEPGNVSIDDRNRCSIKACESIAPILREYLFPHI